MSDYLTALLEVVWALRWVLTAVVFAALVAILLDLRGERDSLRCTVRDALISNAEYAHQIEALKASNADLRSRLYAARRGTRRPIIAGRVVS